MDIDISETRSREIIKILEIYPQGHLEIKFERVFWCADYVEPEMREGPNDRRGPPSPPKNRSAAEMTRRAGDALGSMMGSPGRRE